MLNRSGRSIGVLLTAVAVWALAEAVAAAGDGFWQTYTLYMQYALEAQRYYGIPPELTLAVIAVESRFDRYVVRDETKGRVYRHRNFTEACKTVKKLIAKRRLVAVGLGQIVVQYWPEVVSKRNVCLLLNPRYNIIATAYILREIYDESSPKDFVQLVARYNAGRKWATKRGYKYALKVLAAYRVLRMFVPAALDEVERRGG